jgi:hypothetical protein
VCRADNLSTFHVPTVLKSGSLKLLEPYGPAQACNLIVLPFIGGVHSKGAHTRTSLARESASGSLTRDPGSAIYTQSGPKNVYTLYSLFYMSKCILFLGHSV